jgi:hypothetical protein
LKIEVALLASIRCMTSEDHRSRSQETNISDTVVAKPTTTNCVNRISLLPTTIGGHIFLLQHQRPAFNSFSANHREMARKGHLQNFGARERDRKKGHTERRRLQRGRRRTVETTGVERHTLFVGLIIFIFFASKFGGRLEDEALVLVLVDIPPTITTIGSYFYVIASFRFTSYDRGRSLGCMSRAITTALVVLGSRTACDNLRLHVGKWWTNRKQEVS